MFVYEITCDCGHKERFEHAGAPRPDAAPLVRVVCSACGRILYGRLPRQDGREPYVMRADTLRIRRAILDLFAEQGAPLTVRQVFYALSVRQVIPKSERGYRVTQYHLAQMRRDGSIPYGWIADNTRWQIKSPSYSGLRAALQRTREIYRRDLWADQGVYVEVWVEKDALAGVISRVTDEFGVPLLVARGYSSMTFLYEAAEAIKAIGKPTYVYHFGDYDPSGVNAAEKIQEGLAEHGARVHFERVAVTEEQIEQYSLPSRPTKKGDPRSKKWGHRQSVELDALPAPILRDLVRDCITRHIDVAVWKRTLAIEAEERRTLEMILSYLPQVQGPAGVVSTV